VSTYTLLSRGRSRGRAGLRSVPMLPAELSVFPDFDCYRGGEAERAAHSNDQHRLGGMCE